MSYATGLRIVRNAAVILVSIYLVVCFIAWDWVSPLATGAARFVTVYWAAASIFFGWALESAMAYKRAKAAGIPVREG